VDSTARAGTRLADTRSEKASRPDDHGHGCIKKGRCNGKSGGLGE